MNTQEALEQRLKQCLEELSTLLPIGIEPWLTFHKEVDDFYEVIEIFDTDSDVTLDAVLSLIQQEEG